MIVNLQRDAVFVATEDTPIDFGTESTWNPATDLLANTSAVVNDAYAKVHTNPGTVTVIVSATKVRTMGLWIQPPGSELTPYRVKCYAGADDPAVSFRLGIGYSNNVIDGTNDNVNEWETFHFDKELDELFLIAPAVGVGTNPIFFGICLRGITTGVSIDSHLSVQRLATSPPQFSQSVS